MTQGWRAFYGAAVGALAVLLLHPMSRPFLLTSLSHWGTSDVFYSTDLILSNHAVLPVPEGLLDAGLWMEYGAEKVSLHQPMSANDLDTMLRVAKYAASQNPDNAFWQQMEAVFYDALSKSNEISPKERMEDSNQAVRSWIIASNLSKWDDYQTRRLETIRGQLAQEAGSNEAWQYSAVYPLRLSAAGDCIDAYSRELLRGLGFDTHHDLELRYATLMNGKLLRDGARSIALGGIGAAMVERATYPPTLSKQITPRILVLSRFKLINRLEKDHEQDKAREADDVFNMNDGWLALLDQPNHSAQNQQLRTASLVTIDLPGALLGTAILGGVLWVLSVVLGLNPRLLRLIELPFAPAIGLCLGGVLYLSTGLTLVSIAVAACFSFLALTPSHERKKAPDQLGPVFEFMLFLLACAFAVFLIAFFVGLSTPGCQLLPDLGVQREYYGGSTLLLGLCFVVLALLLLAAPAWAMAQRIATPKIVVQTLRQFGRGLFLCCLALAIFATPLCIIRDRSLQRDLRQIVGNEPLYYQYNG